MKVNIIARDKYSTILSMVRYFLADYSPNFPIEITILDNGYPSSMLRKCEAHCKSKGISDFKIEKFEEFANTNTILNQVILANSSEDYIVIIENDCLFSCGSLQSLYLSAQNTNYTCISPWILNVDNSVHFKPTVNEIRFGKNDVKLFLDRGRTEINPTMSSQGDLSHIDIIERHCLLIKVNQFKKLLPLDEMMDDRTDIDLSIQLKSAGESSALHYGISATFMNTPNLKWDKDYLSYRWNINKVAKAHARLLKKWNISNYKTTIHHAYEIRQAFLGEKAILRDCYGNLVQ